MHARVRGDQPSARTICGGASVAIHRRNKGQVSAYSHHIQNDMIEGVAAPATIAVLVSTGTEKNAKKNKKTGKNKSTASNPVAPTRIHQQLLSRVKAAKAKAQTTRASYAERPLIGQNSALSEGKSAN